MQRILRLISLLMCLGFCGAALSSTALAQDSPSSTSRKIVNEVSPVYPALAGKLNLSGTVKLLITVAPNGTAKSVDVVGGHPVLVPAAQSAISKWRWAPAKDETKEIVEMRFQPH